VERSDEKANVRRRGRYTAMVIVILVVFLSFAYLVRPRLSVGLNASEPQTAEQQVRMLGSALDTMRRDIGRYPTVEEGLALLVTAPADAAAAKTWHGPYIEGNVPLDPWNHPYHYSPVGRPPNPIALYSDHPADSFWGGMIGLPPRD
jgi:general secretion pathway protein G